MTDIEKSPEEVEEVIETPESVETPEAPEVPEAGVDREAAKEAAEEAVIPAEPEDEWEKYEAELKKKGEDLDRRTKELEEAEKQRQADYTRKTQLLQTIADTQGKGEEFRNAKRVQREARKQGVDVPLEWKPRSFVKGDTPAARNQNILFNAVAGAVTRELGEQLSDKLAVIEEIRSQRVQDTQARARIQRWGVVGDKVNEELGISEKEAMEIGKRIVNNPSVFAAADTDDVAGLEDLYRTFANGVRSSGNGNLGLPTRPKSPPTKKKGTGPDTLGPKGRATGREVPKPKKDEDIMSAVLGGQIR